MPLPKQVRQQIAEAKRIEDALRAAAPAEIPQAAEPTPLSTPAAAPVEQPPAAASQPAPVPAPQHPLDAQYAELLQQYRSLQGIHRGLVRTNGDLQSQVQTLQAQVQGMNEELRRLQQPAAPASPVAPITDDEIKEFGPDLISVIERKAQIVAAPLNEALARSNQQIEKLTARDTELEQSLGGVSRAQAENTQEIFASRLMKLVPDFNALNFDKNFLSWLSQVDPLDANRRTLQQRLDEAVSVGDVGATASFFATYKTLVLPAQVAAQPVKPNIAAQVQPASRSAPDATPVKPGAQWTQADISHFYADVARGRYTPQEKVRIEKEIFAAQKDNRIAA